VSVDVPAHAHRVDPLAARDASSTAFCRARDEEIVVDPTDDLGRYRVRVGGGDIHDVTLVEDHEGHVGACDCDGFAFHTGDGAGESIPGGVCAHLCAVAMNAVVGSTVVPEVDGYAVDPILEGDTPGQDDVVVDHVEPDVVEHGDDQDDGDDQEDDDAVREQRTTSDEPDPEPRDGESRDGDGGVRPVPPHVGAVDDQDPDDLEEFVTSVAGVPEVFVVDMGRGGSRKPYVTKEGLNYIARKVGIQTRAEPIKPTWEGDGDVAAYRGVAVDDDGRRYEDVATAHAEQVQSTVGSENLDELASTRATNRALRLATGCGFASVEEVDSDAAITPGDRGDANQDVATDGGR
jgi:hypothetical protein